MELKPCPFCGSMDVHVMESHRPRWKVWVRCDNCGARGGCQKVEGCGVAPRQLAQQGWNQRAEERGKYACLGGCAAELWNQHAETLALSDSMKKYLQGAVGDAVSKARKDLHFHVQRGLEALEERIKVLEGRFPCCPPQEIESVAGRVAEKRVYEAMVQLAESLKERGDE